MKTSEKIKESLIRMYDGQGWTADAVILKAADYSSKGILTADDLEYIQLYVSGEDVPNLTHIAEVAKAQAVMLAHALGAEVELTPEIMSLATESAQITELASDELWRVGVRVTVGTVVEYNGTDYECRQAHVTQGDWTPSKTPALWSVVQPAPADGEVLQWVAGVAVKIGDKRTYNGDTYECIQAHTTQAGWEPSKAPSLWKKI